MSTSSETVGNERNQAGPSSRRDRNAAVQNTNQITGDRKWWALVAVLISMFFSALDQTVVGTALPTIISELHGLSLYTWTITAYILASAVTVPLYGRLSDTYGRKPFYIFGLIVFLIGSALCGMSHTMTWLIASRALQGIGGGAMMSMPRATIGDIFNPRERGRWMGVIMGVFGLASLVGPGLGGWLTDAVNWRWVFYINIPVALIALGMILYALPTVRTGAGHKLDWPGSILLFGMIAALVFAVTWGGDGTYAWTSATVLGLFAASAALLLAFILNERAAAEPVIPMMMFRNSTFVSVMTISLLIMMSMISVMIFLPIYVQGVLGKTATTSGFMITPMMLSFIVGGIVGGQLMTRTGRYKLQCIIGAAVLVVGAYLLSQLGVASTWGEVVRDMIIMGLGIGSLMPVMGTVVQNLFPYKMMGQVNATQQSIQTLAMAVAAPIFGAVLASRFSGQLAKLMPTQLTQLFAKLPPGQQKALADPQSLVTAQAQEAIQQQFAGFGAAGQQLYQQFITALHQALANATADLYAVGLVFAVLAFLATFLLREVHLKQEEFYAESAGAGESTTTGEDVAAGAEPAVGPAGAGN